MSGGATQRTGITKPVAAGVSIASNSLLIGLKLAAAAITGSVAILSEALHSMIDLIASVIAFVSVRKADEPADVEHPPEDGESFAANALIKGRAASQATGEAAIADDSGIEAAALGGRPGVLSARYAGEGASDRQNLDKLIADLAGAEDKRLAYVCALALVDADGAEHLFEGRCEGWLADEPRGEGGFGYDPAFLPGDIGPLDKRTMAELSPDEKHAISHRGRAARAMAERLGGGA